MNNPTLPNKPNAASASALLSRYYLWQIQTGRVAAPKKKTKAPKQAAERVVVSSSRTTE